MHVANDPRLACLPSQLDTPITTIINTARNLNSIEIRSGQPWPIISQFLSSLSPGSIGLDSGTGNGKYLPLDQDGGVLTIGLDRSLALLSIAQGAGGGSKVGGGDDDAVVRREVVRADALLHCWRDAAFVSLSADIISLALV